MLFIIDSKKRKVWNMEKNVVGTDVNQIEIRSLSHIHGQPQVTDKLSVHISAHFNTKSSSKNSDSFLGRSF